MDYVEEYRAKARNLRLIGLGLLTFGIIIFFITICSENFSLIGMVVSFIAPVVGIVFLCSPRMAYRQYNGSYIIFYNACIKGYLIIDGEIVCVGGASQYDFYGQLPDGTDVHVKVTGWSGNIKFAVGESSNHNISFI